MAFTNAYSNNYYINAHWILIKNKTTNFIKYKKY